MEKKIWGNKIRLVETPTVVVDLLTIKPNSFCSFHHHDYKYNMFFILEGIVTIQQEKDSYIVLRQYDNFVVEPKTKHQFIATTKAKMLEIMYTKPVLEEDIIRICQGGKIIKGRFVTENEIKVRGLKNI